MKTCVFGSAKAALFVAALLALTSSLQAQPNTWISPGSGFWQDGFNWSAGQPTFFQSMFITNAGLKEVIIDNNTALNFSFTMTVSNLTVSGTNNELFLSNAGLSQPLHVRREFDLRASSALVIDTSALLVEGLMKLDGTNTHFDLLSGWGWVATNMVIGTSTSANCLATVESGGSLFVTNSTQNAVLDLAHGGSLTLDGGFLQPDNLILTNGGAFNDLAGTLVFGRAFKVERGSSVTISNALVSTAQPFTLGTFTASTGTLQVLDMGSLTINTALGIGDTGTTAQGAGRGVVTVSNASLSAGTLSMGSSVGGVGTLLVQTNAQVNIASSVNVVSGSLLATSLVTVVGGALLANNGTTRIGALGSGRMDIFDGTVVLRQLILGAPNGLGSGELHMNGGFLQVLGIGSGPGQGLDANFILWEGGDLDGTGTSLTIGDGHDAAVLVSGSFFGRLAAIHAGVSPGFLGSFTQTGGTVIVSTNFIVGGCVNGALGSVVLSGGSLFITNDTQTAVLDARNGTVTIQPGGKLVVDTIVVTNLCGHVINNGGILVMNHPPILDPNMDADNTGQSNATKAAAGLDPFDPTSVFKVSSVTRVNGNDILVKWTTQAGHNYVVRIADDPTNPTLFHDLSPIIPAQGPGAGTATYLDPGVGSSAAIRLYQVRLAP